MTTKAPRTAAEAAIATAVLDGQVDLMSVIQLIAAEYARREVPVDLLFGMAFRGAPGSREHGLARDLLAQLLDRIDGAE